MFKQKHAFTLVELIVVITILAILWTISFISLQWYSETARNSVRVSDVSTMKTSLELFHLDAWKYPTTTWWYTVSYSWTEVWSQWTFWSSTTNNVDRLDDIPSDPLTQKEYTYSTTKNKQEYQISWITEWDEIVLNNTLLNQTNAWEIKTNALVKWNYNWVLFKTSTWNHCDVLAIPSIVSSMDNEEDLVNIISSGWLVFNWYNNLPTNYRSSKYNADGWFDYSPANFVAYSDEDKCKTLSSTKQVWIDARASLVTELQNTYSWTIIESEGVITSIVNASWDTAIAALWTSIVNNSLGGEIEVSSDWGEGGWESAASELITQTVCESAGWFWVDSVDDVYIWDQRGNWFCISPRIADISDSSWWAISWNGWWNMAHSDFYWWAPWNTDDSWNTFDSAWQTRNLDTPDIYTCKTLWTALGDYEWASDTLENRMKWLITNKVNQAELHDIDWIEWVNQWNTYVVPAIYLADCIDWEKDLWTSMTYTHTWSIQEVISYSDYSIDRTNIDDWWIYSGCNQTSTANADLDCIIYQDRQKYLLWWTQKSGSHLPSGYSYISNWASGASSPNSIVSTNERWEYQIACEAWEFLDSNDDIDNEYIWLASIGQPSWSDWLFRTRTIGLHWCGSHDSYTSWQVRWTWVRFVIRP